MKNFELTPKMLSMGGAFYPTGYALIMFPDEQDAKQVASSLEAMSPNVVTDGKEIMLLTPDALLEKLGGADGESHVPLPSVGTEGETLHKYLALAREGNHGLMIPVRSREATERIMEVVRKVPFTYGQKYGTLVIEDLE